MKHAVIAGVGSGIGGALARHLTKRDWCLSGTSRSAHPGILATHLDRHIFCDFAHAESVDRACAAICNDSPPWDLLVLAPATMNPIGRFAEVDVDEWIKCLHINLVHQLRFVYRMLPYANSESASPKCLFFAGGGVNSAPIAYSGYTISKIALVKATELLDAETPEVAFVIVGPGWVRTPIHKETLSSPSAPASLVVETQRRFKADDFVPMEKVLASIDWIIDQPKGVVGGRNFSVASDPIGEEGLADALRANPSLYTLRRLGNDGGWVQNDR